MLRLAGRETPAPAMDAGAMHDRAQPRQAPQLFAQGVSLAQLVRLFTGIAWLIWGVYWYSNSARAGAAPLIAVVLAAAGLAAIPAGVLARSADAAQRLDRLLFAGTAAIIVLTVVSASSWSAIGTDELPYDQFAAGALLHGLNPYAQSYLPLLRQLGIGGGTVTLHGALVPWIAYPALSFLLYVPGVAALGTDSYAASATDALFWVAGAALLWKLAQPQLRCWITLLFGSSLLLAPIIGGDTDALYIPFLVVALWKWDRFADPDERGVWRWIGPVALGVACSIKQTPWLLLPYLAIGVALEARSRGGLWWRQPARYLGIAAAVYLVPNLPFIAWNPSLWAQRTLLPFTGGLAPVGPGPVGLIRAYGWGGGELALFTLAALLAMGAAAALLVARYRELKAILPMLPMPGIFLSTRPFTSYFLFAIPGLVACALSVRATSPRLSTRWTRWAWRAGAAAACAALVAVALGLVARAPFDIAVIASNASGATFTATARVTNVSAHATTPAFVVTQQASPREPLLVLSGPSSLGPGASAIYRFSAQATGYTPHPGDNFQVIAMSTGPDAMSVSPIAVVPAS
ncbi:MAG: hypothetical protein JOZ46_03135 [Candidatus Dormibacteraeota bacterium]|nr:hypothetical protein [Candidatus Dormibacteraeota bacterium]MBV9524794.1 hypothetical protein [Candidatus Dormibacteraeota bacterium]